jgi:hypothetical protein
MDESEMLVLLLQLIYPLKGGILPKNYLEEKREYSGTDKPPANKQRGS